jgi:hypothetical protein
MPKLDLNALRERAEEEIDFEMVEREGENTLRFDMYSGTSIWVHSNGSIDGSTKAGKGKKLADLAKIFTTF